MSRAQLFTGVIVALEWHIIASEKPGVIAERLDELFLRNIDANDMLWEVQSILNLHSRENRYLRVSVSKLRADFQLFLNAASYHESH